MFPMHFSNQRIKYGEQEEEEDQFTGTPIVLFHFSPAQLSAALAQYRPQTKVCSNTPPQRKEEYQNMNSDSLCAHGNYFPNNKMATPRTNTTTTTSAGNGRAEGKRVLLLLLLLR